mmetsp:Transcript_24975/g.98673  ORF Transcript_24975/g.98673 Transcript_24975/m.98673 type:complete len:111 (-) Transcript_24975:1301-1633(-)
MSNLLLERAQNAPVKGRSRDSRRMVGAKFRSLLQGAGGRTWGNIQVSERDLTLRRRMLVCKESHFDKDSAVELSEDMDRAMTSESSSRPFGSVAPYPPGTNRAKSSLCKT